MTSTLINLALLLTSQATAFSVGSILSNQGQRSTSLNYKQRSEDDSYQNLHFNSSAIVYNDFEIRESELTSDCENSAAAASQTMPAAIEPDVDKPSSKFTSPIQMMKLVPKVVPATNSSAFIVAPVIERTESPSSVTDTLTDTVSVDTQSPPQSNGMKPKWSPHRKNFGTTAFQSSNYLSSLSSSPATSPEEQENKILQSSLRNQRGVLRDEKLRSTQEAIVEATRRTDPTEVYMARMAKAEEMRKQKEMEKLEQLYSERQQRLDEKRRLEREGQMTLERYAEERARVDGLKEERELERGSEDSHASCSDEMKREIPVIVRSHSTPLLIGSTITLSDLTPFQIKTLEAAVSLHEEHCTKLADGDNAAAPIVAIIDSYTGDIGPAVVDKQKRFATLAAVEFVKNKNGEVKAANLMGVGRVILHDYFTSNDAGLTKQEAELNELLEKIHYLNDKEENKDDLAIIMAEFDLFLDDSSILSKQLSKHQDATAELYQTANKVYRLHEERKNLLSGLRSGHTRLSLGKSENKAAEYDSWNSEASDDDQIIQDYGFGTYGLFSTIPDLTNDLLSRLEPYYSIVHREREEYEAEIASFVALQALEKCAQPAELAAAMMTPSATERLYMAYGIMSRHRDELLVLAKKLNDDLTECGEDCSDL